MNEDIMNNVGFKEEVKLVKQGLCPFCVQPTNITEFKDELSRKEWRISGLCQKCQDEFFDKGE